MTAAELFDAANHSKGLKDAALARLLNISTASLSIFRHGRAPLPDRLIVELAEIAGLDPAAILPAINATKETHSVNVRAVWEEVAKRSKNRPPPS